MYYFDVKQTAKGDRYLKISEVPKQGERQRIFVFGDHVNEFKDLLERAMGIMVEGNPAAKSEMKRGEL
jgi:hypothetical protein